MIKDPGNITIDLTEPAEVHAFWAALHGPSGAELTPESAPGYQRMPYTELGAHWPDTIVEWGVIAYWSGWTAKTGGKLVSDLLPFNPEWTRTA